MRARPGDADMRRRSHVPGMIVLGMLALFVAGWLGVAGRLGVRAAESPPPSSDKAKTPLPSKDITLDQARAVIDAAVKKSQELQINQDIAVVDAGGNLKAFV